MVASLLLCRCNLRPLRRMWQKEEGSGYMALEENCIPEELLLDWKASEEVGKNCVARVLALAFVLGVAGMGILSIVSSVVTSLEHAPRP